MNLVMETIVAKTGRGHGQSNNRKFLPPEPEATRNKLGDSEGTQNLLNPNYSRLVRAGHSAKKAVKNGSAGRMPLGV